MVAGLLPVIRTAALRFGHVHTDGATLLEVSLVQPFLFRGLLPPRPVLRLCLLCPGVPVHDERALVPQFTPPISGRSERTPRRRRRTGGCYRKRSARLVGLRRGHATTTSPTLTVRSHRDRNGLRGFIPRILHRLHFLYLTGIQTPQQPQDTGHQRGPLKIEDRVSGMTAGGEASAPIYFIVILGCRPGGDCSRPAGGVDTTVWTFWSSNRAIAGLTPSPIRGGGRSGDDGSSVAPGVAGGAGLGTGVPVTSGAYRGVSLRTSDPTPSGGVFICTTASLGLTHSGIAADSERPHG